MNTGLLLIALGFGYKIFIEAVKNTRKSMKRLGKSIGVFIMVIATMGILCSTVCAIKGAGCRGKTCATHQYGGHSKGKICPFTGKVMPDTTGSKIPYKTAGEMGG